MRLIEIPLERIRTGLSYLKGADRGRMALPLDLEEPVTVVEDRGFFELVDGFKRIAALRRRGEKTVWALVRDWDKLKAKAMMLRLNARRKTLSFYEEAVLAADLHRKERLSCRAVGKLLGRKKSWVVKRVVIMNRLDPDVIEFLKAGVIGPTTAYNLSRMPGELQAPLFLSAQEEKLTANEVEAAVSLVLALPEGERRGATRNLRVHISPPAADAVPGEPGLEAIERLIRDAGRVRERLLSTPRGERGEAARRVRRCAVRRLRHAISRLKDALDEVEPEYDERRTENERTGSQGTHGESHVEREEIPPPHRPCPGHGEEAAAEAPRAFPGQGAVVPRGDKEAFEVGSIQGSNPGAGDAYGPDRLKGGVPEPEEHPQDHPQGGVHGGRDHPGGLCSETARKQKEQKGLCPI
jgi:ParB-like chromosome segregation protein Spo0J